MNALLKKSVSNAALTCKKFFVAFSMVFAWWAVAAVATILKRCLE